MGLPSLSGFWRLPPHSSACGTSYIVQVSSRMGPCFITSPLTLLPPFHLQGSLRLHWLYLDNQANFSSQNLSITSEKSFCQVREHSHRFYGSGYRYLWGYYSAYKFSSVTQSCPTVCDPMDCSTPGLPVHHQLLEPAQTHVHGISDAIQPSHPLSSPSPPAFNLSQHRGLFQGVNPSHQVAKVLEFQLQHQSFQ